MTGAPSNDRLAARYWDRAAANELAIRHCGDCGTHHFYPRPFCPHCWSENVEWSAASGEATVHSYTVIRDKEPYVLALIDLAEGPRMMATIVDCALDGIEIGASLLLDFRELQGVNAPVFRICSEKRENA